MINNKRVKVYQLWHKSGDPIPGKYNMCMSQVRELKWIDDYELVRFEPGQNRYETVLKTDDIRLDIACNDPWALIIDADLIITKKLEFPGMDYPYFGERRKHQPHLSLFYVNNCCEWFKKLDREDRLRVYGWTDKLFRSKTYFAIPDNSYIHYWFTRKSPMKGMDERII